MERGIKDIQVGQGALAKNGFGAQMVDSCQCEEECQYPATYIHL